MHRFLIALFLLLTPCTSAAQLPFEELFMRAADRFGLSPECQYRIIEFTRSLEGDQISQLSITSIYPPVFDIMFASGRAIHATGTNLRIKRYDYDDDFDDDDLPFEDYAGLCIAVFLGGFLLAWIGFFVMSFQLAITGMELVFFALMLCL